MFRPCFDLQCLLPFLLMKTESWLFYFNYVLAVLWLLLFSAFSSRCRGSVSGLWSMIVSFPGLEVIKLEYSLKLKIKRNDWLLADTSPQAANHCALF